MPPHLITLEFLGAVRRTLAPDGVVVSNLWKHSYNRKYDGMLRTYQEVFGNVELIETAREVNIILLARPRQQTVDRAEFVARARRLSREKSFRFDLGRLIDLGLQPARAKGADVPVLRDADGTR